MTGRRLTAEQQGYVEKAAPVIQACIAAFILKNPDLRDLAKRCDLEAAAEQAACLAALTYDPAKSGISAYFSTAIRRALFKEVQARQRHERRMLAAWEICKPTLNPHIERMKRRAAQALQMLSPYEKQLLQDHVVDGVTLERLGREQNLDRRIIRKQINRAIDRLREAERDLP